MNTPERKDRLVKCPGQCGTTHVNPGVFSNFCHICGVNLSAPGVEADEEDWCPGASKGHECDMRGVCIDCGKKRRPAVLENPKCICIVRSGTCEKCPACYPPGWKPAEPEKP